MIDDKKNMCTNIFEVLYIKKIFCFRSNKFTSVEIFIRLIIYFGFKILTIDLCNTNFMKKKKKRKVGPSHSEVRL